jgi:predicted O-methyltransferase YrrM
MAETTTPPPFFSRALGSAAARTATAARGLKRRATEEHLRQLGLGHATRIETHMHALELVALYELAAFSPHGAQAVEIGSYLGASTCYLAAGLARCDGRIFCVDTWRNETMGEQGRDTLPDFERHVAPVRSRVVPVRKRSDELVDGDLPASVDLAFIDGDHAYAAAKNDFEKCARVLARKGVLAFHDCLYFPDVSRVVGEALATGAWLIAGHVENLVWLQRNLREEKR